jgi:hypothetical protein
MGRAGRVGGLFMDGRPGPEGAARAERPSMANLSETGGVARDEARC